MIACERDSSTISISCPPKEVILIVLATWGRTDLQTCTNPKWVAQRTSTTCNATVTAIVAALCNNLTKCDLPKSVQSLNDPCVGVDKYLTVFYLCLASVSSSVSSQASPSATVHVGTEVTFTGQVATADTSELLSGSVTLVCGKHRLKTVQLTKGNANFTIQFANLPRGANVLTLMYSGSPGIAPSSSAPIIVNVDGKYITTITLQANASSLPSEAQGQMRLAPGRLQLNGTVSTSQGPVVEGTVLLFDWDRFLGRARLSNKGRFLFLVHNLAAGKHHFTATFAGTNLLYVAKSKPVDVTVIPPAPAN